MTHQQQTVTFYDPISGERYPLTDHRWRSDAGGPLRVTPLPGITRTDIEQHDRTLWRFRAAMPIPIHRPISLGEGTTPLVAKRWHGNPVYFKLEWFSPTGSFKDRGASVMLSFLRQQGIMSILEDSSGNAGAAIAAYGAAADMQVKVLAPSSAQPAKIAQIRAFGAEIELVPGPRSATTAEAIRQSNQRFYASHNWHPLFLHGTKTLGYELWEDLGYRVPDNIIIPAGAGSNVLGCDLAFQELKRAGAINHIPRLFAVQPANCAPINAHFHGSKQSEFLPTMAEGTAIQKPMRGQEVVDAVRNSGGTTVVVAEAAIANATLSLARNGLYAEPTSAMAAAAYDILFDSRLIRADETTVVILTGSGLKASAKLQTLLDNIPDG